MNKPPIACQPAARCSMLLSGDGLQADEKATQRGYCKNHDQHSHKSACARRKIRMATIISLVLAAIGVGTFILLCYLDVTGEDYGGMISFWKRAVGTGNTTSTAGDGPFVRNKLWIIVLVVGLFVCLILAIMLSAWCCRGAFENPLCCPCYLCACCGGLGT
ncbi:hypothetical protein M408DRAFT_288517 [Serendipita vermifera MAFF 305830]|uniref:Transmembrane protein n=1 Tax=Serendipita vermifera MAFF 305830 TaxID=933852 RepID=A0A0C3B1G2_SERVB|nr:hypothetical protein M408DRAFT_288517 [Serendipita vermifera MAFF 305830]